MAEVYAYDAWVPVIDPQAWVHPTAVLIGDVLIGPGCYVGPGAVLRGDFGRIELKQGANFQDNCVAHSFPGTVVLVEEDGHVGHGAILHGCRVGRNAMIGMNSVVMDRAVIGENAIVGAMSFVKAGMEVPANSLVLGSPARVVRQLSADEMAWKAAGTRLYQQLAAEAPAKVRRTDPLSEVEADRPQLGDAGYRPLMDLDRS